MQVVGINILCKGIHLLKDLLPYLDNMIKITIIADVITFSEIILFDKVYIFTRNVDISRS